MAHQIIDEFEYADNVAEGGFGTDDIIVDDPQANDLQVAERKVGVSKPELPQARLDKVI